MQQIRICPECDTEYLAHVDACADCGASLLLPEENEKLQEERRQCAQKTLESAVVVREGDQKWIEELYHVLIDSLIPCVVHVDHGCKKGCCGPPYQLLVSSEDFEKARECIEEHYMKVHPEIRASKEMMSQGRCPACGSPVGADALECPDCGLTLLIME